MKSEDKLPDFLIIGAQKCGTSSLGRNIEQHPQIKLARNSQKKLELHFFDKDENFGKGLEWYKSHFTHTDMIQGEKTPSYIFKLISHRRMYQTLPNVKLILILRNPVTRAYSHWNHRRRVHSVSNDFEDDISICPMIIERGKYIDQIEHLLKYFSLNNLHITVNERVRKNMVEEYNKIYYFLKLPTLEGIKYSRNFRTNYPQPMCSETRDKLKQFYQPYNKKLYEFLGYNIPEWELE